MLGFLSFFLHGNGSFYGFYIRKRFRKVFACFTDKLLAKKTPENQVFFHTIEIKTCQILCTHQSAILQTRQRTLIEVLP